MAKYDPLFEHLYRAGDDPVTMSFNEVAVLVGGLPASAERHRAWWGNEVDPQHVQAKAWVNSGRQVSAVDVAAKTVTFVVAHWTRGS